MKIKINNKILNFEEAGTPGGTPLVFLHYWGGSSRTWNGVISKLGVGFRTIAVDLRGWGESEGSGNSYSLSDMAGDVEAVIHTLGLRNYVLVGHSMGGKVAQLIASRNPEGPKGLFLITSAGPGPTHMPREARTPMLTAYDSQTSVEKAIDHVLSGKKLDPGLRAQVIEDSLRGTKEAKLAWPVSSCEEDFREEAKRIQVPVFIVAGEADKIDTLEVLRSHLLPYYPKAKMAILPKTGHLAPLESPEEIADLIREFVPSI